MRALRAALAIVVIAALPARVDAAFAYVTSSANEFTSHPSAQVTAGASIPAGGLIIACEDVFSETPSSVPTDTLSNTYAAFGTAATDGSTGAIQCWYAVNASTGTPTVTFHNTGDPSITSTFLYVAGYTGNATSSVLVAASHSSALSANTTETCASGSATASGQLVFGFIATQNGATSFAPNSSETERFEESTFHQTQIEDKTTSGAGSVSTSWTLGSGQITGCVQGIFALPVVAPTFSVNPAIGMRTTSSIPITATSACTDCTFYGVAETDGLGAPTCTQIKAGQGADGNSAYKSFSAAMTANVQVTGTFSSYTDGTKRDSAFCMNSTANGDSAVFTLADIDKIPVSTCTYSSATSGGATYSCTLDGPGTVYGVACIKDSTDATLAQVMAGQCTGGAAAKAAANRSGTGSLTVGTTLPNPVYDFSFAGAYNFGSQVEASTHQDFDRCLANPTGKQIINCPTGLTSIGSGSAVESLNAAISPGWATGDIPVCDALTTPGGYGPISPATTLLSVDGFVSYSAAGDTSRQYVNCDVYDVSAGAMATAANADNDLDWYNNDPPISCSSPFSTSPYVLKTNVAMSAAPNPGNIDFSTKCTHPLGDTLAFAVTTGTLPTGLALASPTLSGTPTVENESGAALVVTATSGITGLTGTQPFTLYPFTTLALPDCVTSLTLQAACNSAILATFKNAITVQISFVNDNTIAVGYVISETPSAGTEVAPYDTVALLVSLGSAVTTVTTPKCIGDIFANCVIAVAQTSSVASISSTCAANDEVYSQSPAVGKTVDQAFLLTALCR